MTVDVLASEPHFLDHVVPVWLALPDDVRGSFAVHRSLLGRARAAGVAEPVMATSAWLHRPTPVLVAGYGDVRLVRRRRPVILMEHGAGQTYAGRRHQSYAGGVGRDHVALFLCPSDRVAAANLAANPRARCAVVGCPKLDRWHGRRWKRHQPPVVAVAWHWRCLLWPESIGALDHYRSVLPALAARFHVLGHGHPRLWRDPRANLERTYRLAGIEPVREFAEVMDRADVLVCDNSSVLFEFAATDRPVVVANAPWYRRDVEHGLRFWQYADVGVQVDEPADLVAAVERALVDPPAQRRRRAEVTAAVYGVRDGGAATAAARAIMDWLAMTTRSAP